MLTALRNWKRKKIGAPTYHEREAEYRLRWELDAQRLEQYRRMVNMLQRDREKIAQQLHEHGLYLMPDGSVLQELRADGWFSRAFAPACRPD